jgi:hypothetical protein
LSLEISKILTMIFSQINFGVKTPDSIKMEGFKY